MNILRAVLAVLLAWPMLSQASAFDSFPAPPASKIDVVGEDMRMNGIRMSAWELRSEDDLPTTLEFYRQIWATGDKERPGYTLVSMGDWVLLTHVDESAGNVYTVQAREEGEGSFALLAVTDLQAGKGVMPETLVRDFPRLAGSTVESVIESQEIGWTARTIIQSNRQSVKHNIEHYSQSLQGQGWQVEQAVLLRDGDGAMSAIRGGDRLNLSVVRQGSESRTVAVWESR